MIQAQRLAIVIPAYKAQFLSQALESIAQQTSQRFTLYIGDDASPHNLQAIVAPYEHRMEIKYTRFDINMGGADLVAQWGRCIDLTDGEEWIWLFSDDDVMEPGCVQHFYDYLDKNPKANLLHFNTKIMNAEGKTTEVSAPFPQHISVARFWEQKLQFKFNSFVVEYIFKKEAFINAGGFQPFDLGWGSDDATWMKLGLKGGIDTIPDGHILWRWSNTNISSILDDKHILHRKLKAVIQLLKWTDAFFEANKMKIEVPVFMKLKWAIAPVKHAKTLKLSEKLKYATELCDGLNVGNLKYKLKAYLLRTHYQ